jgi:hypothetical protein
MCNNGLNVGGEWRILQVGQSPGREALMDFLLDVLAATAAGVLAVLVARWLDRR